MDRHDLLELASGCTKELSSIACVLACRNEGLQSPLLGEFGAYLFQISDALERCGLEEHQGVQERLPKLLRDLEKACMWPQRPQHTYTDAEFPTLRAIKERKKGVKEVKSSLASLMLEKLPRESLFRNLNKFLQTDQLGPTTRKTQIPPPDLISVDELPPRVHWTIYRALQECIYCGCDLNGIADLSLRKHHGRICLKATLSKRDGDLVFDTVFQVSQSHASSSGSRLQLLRFLIPSASNKSPGERRVRIVDSLGHESASAHQPTETEHTHEELLDTRGFCDLLQRRLGPVYLRVRVHGHGLRDLDEVETAKPMLSDKPNISLADALAVNKLSGSGKVLLAHLIARSVYNYYDSKWMCVKWTQHNIHFLPQPAEDSDQSEGAIYDPLSPCVPMVFGNEGQPEPLPEREYLNGHGVVHRAPRILALGVILLDIMRERPRRTRSSEDMTWQECLNTELVDCSKILEDQNWPAAGMGSKLARSTIRDAVTACFDTELFMDNKLTASERRDILYKRVVWPLEYLVRESGFNTQQAKWVPLGADREMSDLNVQTNTIQKPEVQGQLLNTTPSGNESEAWLDRIANSQLQFDIRAHIALQPSWCRTKMAVLDTGYDPDCTFLSSSKARRARIRGYKDFISGSSPKDGCGHGTHVLSVAMKVAPSVDMYVARVAGDDEDFPIANERIARAIHWAVHEMKVDIVSMSFGFPREEHPPLISRSIQHAVAERDNRILFFAAASNSGGNQGTCFPASHPSVIPVRATNARGVFQDYNPPLDFHGADVVGSLGQDVKGAWINEEEVVKSGTSVSTPVAAGIAALVLDAARLSTTTVSEDLMTKLGTKTGLEAVFRTHHIGRQMQDRFWYLNPAPFCNATHDKRELCLKYAVSST